MEELNSQQQETLRFIHQSQHEESLGHRRSIFNAFSLSMTGLMVILGGIVSASHMPPNLKWVVGFAVVSASFIICNFMRQQRRESEKAMAIMRAIENRLGLYTRGSYLPDKSVLPQEFETPPKTLMGLTRGDRFQAGALIVLALVIIIVLILLPVSPPVGS